jgi:hypothetical protein
MAKVSIIEINLGDINKIVADNVAELHGDAKSKLEEIIQQKKSALKEAEQKQQKKIDEANLINTTLAQVYERLLNAGADGIAAGIIEDMIKEAIDNMVSFTARMKTFLKNRQNDYALKKKKRKSIYYYSLEKFNIEDDCE